MHNYHIKDGDKSKYLHFPYIEDHDLMMKGQAFINMCLTRFGFMMYYNFNKEWVIKRSSAMIDNVSFTDTKPSISKFISVFLRRHITVIEYLLQHTPFDLIVLSGKFCDWTLSQMDSRDRLLTDKIDVGVNVCKISRTTITVEFQIKDIVSGAGFE